MTLTCRDLITVIDGHVAPTLDLSGLMMKNQFQAMTVFMPDKYPTMEKAQDVHTIYAQGMWQV